MASPTITSLATSNWGTSGGPGANSVAWSAGDIIAVYAGGFHTGGTGPNFTVSGGTGLTWHNKKSTLVTTIGTDWWVSDPAPSAQSAQTISIAQSAGGAQGAYIIAAISGATGRDPNASVPDNTASSAHTCQPITTTDADDLLFIAAFQASTATQMTTPTGWSAGPSINCSISAGGIHSATKSVAATQSAVTATFGSSATGPIVSDAFTSDAQPVTSHPSSRASIIW